MRNKLVWTIALIIIFSTYLINADSMVKKLMNGDQGLLIVGQIVSENDLYFEISVEHVLQGKELKRIKVEKAFDYSFLSEKPKIEDTCLMSLNPGTNAYQVTNGAYKTDSVNYKTLSIVADHTERYATAIKLFVNSNGRISEFTFKENRIYYKNLDGTTVVVDVDSTITNETTTTEEHQEEGWLMPVNETYILLMFIFIVVMAISVSNQK